MDKKESYLTKIFIPAIFSFLLILSGIFNPVNISRWNYTNIQHARAEDNNLYLPIVQKPVIPIFGIESHILHSSWLQEKAEEANVYWTRSFQFSWKDIEPVRTTPPTYHWDKIDETALINAQEHGLHLIAVVKFTPDWAQKFPGHACGPVAEENLDEFAEFMQAVVARYSSYPYNIKYWEIGNEPDVDPSLVPGDSILGCWGDKDDDYYGGGYYAEALKYLYPAVKSADPDSKILIGGLLLDCNPDNPPPNTDCSPGKFFEGILNHNGSGDGGNYFDIVSFHGYPYYYGGEEHGGLYFDENDGKWGGDKGRGIVLGKIDFLRGKMGDYSIDKPIMQTEGALLKYCSMPNPADCPTPPDDFFEKQADYVVWLYIRNWAEHILGTIWYTLEGPGWRYGGLLDESQQPKPAYNALQFMTQELDGAVFLNKITDNPDVRGFAFRKSARRVWVLWTPDEEDHIFQLPANYTNENTLIYDKYGNLVSWTPSDITVNQPIFVDHAP